jgi:hypothetical protein
MKVAFLPFFICSINLSSITTSVTQPVGRQRTKPARPTSISSILRPRPEGRPRGRDIEMSRALAEIYDSGALSGHAEMDMSLPLKVRYCSGPCQTRVSPRSATTSSWTGLPSGWILSELRPKRTGSLSLWKHSSTGVLLFSSEAGMTDAVTDRAHCVILVDNSNVFIGQKFSARRKGLTRGPTDSRDPQDPSWRIEFGGLLEFMGSMPGRKLAWSSSGPNGRLLLR